MQIAIVGCGFVADYYLTTLPLHPELKLKGVFDKLPERSKHFSEFHSVPAYNTLDELLNDEEVDIVLNLTNPRDHYEISLAALKTGKHVYSEKPLGMNMDEAKELVELADSKNLQISSAPCSLLSETAQTIWHALREETIGKVRVVYAEMDDGLIHLMSYDKWLSASGIPWPSKDEFEVGCTLEHAGYYVPWFAAFFGPATSVTAFGSTQIENKAPGVELNMDSPDFTVACIQFASGVVVRLTCSIIAPHDHQLKIVGDKGILFTKDCWDYYSPVYSRKMMRIRRKTFFNPIKRRHKMAMADTPKIINNGAQRMDFSRGVAEMAAAIRENRPSRLSSQFSLHVNEIALAIHHAREQGATYQMTTTFNPIAPTSWAQGELQKAPVQQGKGVRWGILGTGMVAKQVASCFEWAENASLVAVGSRSEETAKAFATTYNIPKAYSSYEEMLNDDDIDVIYIATPHHRHKDDCLTSFNHNKAVMCEKPFSLDLEEAREIVKAAQDKGIFCMEAMWARFFPLLHEVKRRIDAGEIGEVISLTADFGYPTPYDPDNRFFNLKKGGGALLDRGVYLLSLAQFLLGKHESITSVADIGKTGVDETSSYLLQYASGAVANLSATLMGYGTNEAIINGSKGSIRLHAPFFQPSNISVSNKVSKQPLPTSPGPMPKVGKINQRIRRMVMPKIDKMTGAKLISKPYPSVGYQFEISEVSRCIQAGLTESKMMPLDDTLDVMDTMDEIRQQLGLTF
jgi:predicted dehydrogenase